MIPPSSLAVRAPCGYPLSPTHAASRPSYDAAVEAARFEALRSIEAAKGFHEKVTEGSFFRRGSANSWRDELSETQIERIVSDHGAMMARFGYERQAVS